MADSLFLGLDVGTSGVKALLVAPSGEVTRSATAPLTLETPRPGWAEQDPEAWWAATLAALDEVLADGAGHRVEAVGISGQMHSSVFLSPGSLGAPRTRRLGSALRRSGSPPGRAG